MGRSKKDSTKSKSGTDDNCEQKQQEHTTDTNSIDSSTSTTSTWTPLQVEQTQLAKELDLYITEFQQKALRLNFKPSDCELVILFITNLHPRFRRYVEPAELSCSTWIEAAAFARLHCTRISVIMGCERHDKDPMFRSPESKALIDSGYFVSSSSPSSCLYTGEEGIQHLLSPTEVNTKSEEVSPVKAERSITESASISESSSSRQQSKESITTDSSTTVKTSKEVTTTEEVKNVVNGDIPLAALSIMENNAHELMEMLYNPEEPEKVEGQQTKTVTAKSKKDKEKDKQYLLPRVTAVKSNGSLSNSQSICYRVPEEHSGVNLTFLELEVNNKKVKGLLAKVRWGSSAIGLDCVKRLGLQMKETNNFCIYTDFGYEDSIGILKLPIVHPADSSIKSEMEIQVLPQIYGGNVELVLGADFFYYFNPVLNIKTRAIHFLGKEAPYHVATI
ncbi:unnamed protein product [Mucor hiemalis]